MSSFETEKEALALGKQAKKELGRGWTLDVHQSGSKWEIKLKKHGVSMWRHGDNDWYCEVQIEYGLGYGAKGYTPTQALERLTRYANKTLDNFKEKIPFAKGTKK